MGKVINNQTIRAAIMASLMLIALLFACSSPSFAEPIGSGALHVFGDGLTADPSQQNAPVNTCTAVDTTKVDLGDGDVMHVLHNSGMYRRGANRL